jgi:hypothetical protein
MMKGATHCAIWCLKKEADIPKQIFIGHSCHYHGITELTLQWHACLQITHYKADQHEHVIVTFSQCSFT